MDLLRPHHTFRSRLLRPEIKIPGGHRSLLLSINYRHSDRVIATCGACRRFVKALEPHDCAHGKHFSWASQKARTKQQLLRYRLFTLNVSDDRLEDTIAAWLHKLGHDPFKAFLDGREAARLLQKSDRKFRGRFDKSEAKKGTAWSPWH